MTSKFGVRPEKEKALRDRMAELGIREKDMEETFLKSGGPGGQNVNKVSTCVRLKHIPTSIMVRADKERSQGLNRFLARRVLVSRIEESVSGKPSPGDIKREKLRKQRKRRERRSRAKSPPE